MSGILDDQGGARRRYRLAGGTSTAPGPGQHVDESVAAFALGALDGPERASVERHARLCARCAGLIADERRVVAMLPLAVAPSVPAPDVKVALFARIAQAERAASAELPAGHVRSLPPTLTIPTSRQGPVPAVNVSADVPPAPWLAETTERRSLAARLGSFATVPLLLALVATGAWGFQMRERVAQSTDQVGSLRASLANFGAGTELPLYGNAAEAEGHLLIGSDELRGKVQMSLDPDPDRAYKLVGIDTEGAVVPIADLEVDDQGNSQVFSFGQPFDNYQKVEVQAEPVSGEADGTVQLLSGDVNGSIGASDATSNNAAP